MLAASADRKEFTIRPLAYYRDLFTAFNGNFPPSLGESRMGAQVYLASHNGITIAGSVIVTYGDRLIYLFSGSSDEGRRLKAPYLIQQHAISDGQRLGSGTYDLWGIPTYPKPRAPGGASPPFTPTHAVPPLPFPRADSCLL